MKILIVDDHALVREGLAQVLQNLSPDLQLLQAKDGAQALATLLPHQDMDLVLLDYQLPDSNGLDVLRDIGNIQPALPVLMMSGQCTAQVMRQALQLGALGFISISMVSSPVSVFAVTQKSTKYLCIRLSIGERYGTTTSSDDHFKTLSLISQNCINLRSQRDRYTHIFALPVYLLGLVGEYNPLWDL